MSRTRWFDAVGRSVTPADALIDESDRLISLGVTEIAVRLAIDSASFERAAANLLRASGISIGEETLRKLTEDEGKLLLCAQQTEQMELDFSAKDCTTDQTPDQQPTTRVYLGSDGVLVPVITDAEKQKRRTKAVEKRRVLPRPKGRRRRALPSGKRGADQSYKEFKIVTYYDQDQKHRWVRATRRNHRHAGKLMRQGAAELHLRAAAEKIAITDGAKWIGSEIDRNVGCLDAKVLDFYHLAEHVHAARRAVFGELAPPGTAWADELLHAIRHEGYDPFWQKLTETRSATRSPGKRTALDQLMHYVAQRRDMLDYAEFHRRGWDIGSGSTESMCKALTRRLKQRGMRWDADNAEAIMALETLEQTDGWQNWLVYRAAISN